MKITLPISHLTQDDIFRGLSVERFSVGFPGL